MPRSWIQTSLHPRSQLSCDFLPIRLTERLSRRRFLGGWRLASNSTLSAAMPDCGHCLQDTNPYTYTSGHWLHRDREQRDARYIGFDFDQLRKKVIGLCRGANKVTSCHKHEGGFNRVFVFTLDHTQRVVARLPTPIAGPPELTTNSEVATIEYRESIRYCLSNTLALY